MFNGVSAARRSEAEEFFRGYIPTPGSMSLQGGRCFSTDTSLTVRYDEAMIGYVEGNVHAKRATYCIVAAGGVGYKIFCTKNTLASLHESEVAALWTHTAVREDILDLYGFSAEDDLRFFELLLTVSGIGPKSALAILDVADASTLRNAIAGGNSSYLTNVSGIGRKTAEKILLELRDKVGLADSTSLRGDEEALAALRALGYTQAESRDALRKVPQEITASNDRLREALKIVGNK